MRTRARRIASVGFSVLENKGTEVNDVNTFHLMVVCIYT
jgi:hypothetical protein